MKQTNDLKRLSKPHVVGKDTTASSRTVYTLLGWLGRHQVAEIVLPHEPDTVDLMVLLGMDRDDASEMHAQMKGHKPLDFATLFDMDPSH